MGIEDIANTLNGHPAAEEPVVDEAPVEGEAPAVEVGPEPVEPQASAEAEPAKEEKAQTAKEPPDDRVPLPAYLEEKKARREMERELAALREEMKRYSQHQEQVAAAARERQQAEDTVFKPSVKYEDDPVEYLRQQNDHLARRVEERDRIAQEQERRVHQERQQAAQHEQFRQYVTAQENEFRGQQQDYDAAVEYIRDKRVEQLREQLRVLGYPDSPDHRRAIAESVLGEFYGLAERALQNRVNPAAALYEIARQWGYAAAPAPQAKQDSKMDRIEKGQKAARSVAAVAGREAAAGEEGEEEEESNLASVLHQAQKAAGYRR